MRMRDTIEALDGTAFPGKTFADAVLEPVFNTQRDHYYHAFLWISEAHALMLHEQGILSLAEAQGLLKGLAGVGAVDFSGARYNPAYEDMFFMLEKDLMDRVGTELAGRLHIARSRNDIGICQFRMALREQLIRAMRAVLRFMDTLAALSEENLETVMPAYTHTQPAQPTTLAHYLMAFYDGLERSLHRLLAAYGRVNLSPLGAAAITTTGFPISRERTAALLGFDGLVENAYDSIAGADYLTESAAALMVLGTDLSRFLKDTLDFCTREYGYYRLADPYVQTSSIMPQKRNPSSLEHARPIASAMIGEAQTVFAMIHNTPFGDMVDSEEQLQPHLYASVRQAERVLSLLTSNFATMTVDKARMRENAGAGFITATELADTLVREKGLSFRQSHHVTAQIVRMLHDAGLTEKDLHAEMLAPLLSEGVAVDEETVRRALDPEHFIRIRGITGGPAPEEMRRMLAVRLGMRDALREQVERRSEQLVDARKGTDGAIERLMHR